MEALASVDYNWSVFGERVSLGLTYVVKSSANNLIATRMRWVSTETYPAATDQHNDNGNIVYGMKIVVKPYQTENHNNPFFR